MLGECDDVLPSAGRPLDSLPDNAVRQLTLGDILDLAIDARDNAAGDESFGEEQ